MRFLQRHQNARRRVRFWDEVIPEVPAPVSEPTNPVNDWVDAVLVYLANYGATMDTVATVVLTDTALSGIAPHLMSAPALAALPQVVRLGRRRPKTRPAALQFRNYFAEQELRTPPPTVIDYYTKAMPSLARMYRNDVEGNCVVSGAFHAVGIWSANDTPDCIVGTDAEVSQQYQQICGPGDNGCVIVDVLEFQKAHGLTLGGQRYKIDGYVLIDWRNKLQVQVALLLFGVLKIGVNLPQAWTTSNLWDVTNSPIVGGHNIEACGYNAQGVQISSWGRVYTITWAAFVSTRWVEELYAVLSPNWYNSDKLAPNGIDVTTLQVDLAKLGSGTIPEIDPTPIPPPPPIDPPPAPSGTIPMPVSGSYRISETSDRKSWKIVIPKSSNPLNNGASAMFYPYPPGLPLTELQSLLGYFRGTPPPPAETIHAAWGLVGYGLSRIMPDSPQAVGSTGVAAPSARASTTLAAKVEQLANAKTAATTAVGFDWREFVTQLLVEVIGKLL